MSYTILNCIASQGQCYSEIRSVSCKYWFYVALYSIDVVLSKFETFLRKNYPEIWFCTQTGKRQVDKIITPAIQWGGGVVNVDFRSIQS